MTKDKFKKKLKEKFWNGQFIEIHSGDVDKIINLVEDNPVPSIDKKLLIEDLEHLIRWYQGRDVNICNRVESYINSLQNGVETDKEEPK